MTEWPTVRFRYLFRRVDNRRADAPLASATKSGVALRSDLEQSVWNPSDDVSNFKLVEPNDFVIGLRSFQFGIAHSAVRGLVSPAYTVLRGDRIHPGYFKYVFRSAWFISLLENLSQGIRQGRTIDVDALMDVQMPVPPHSEQRRIGDFLGRAARTTTHLANLRHRQVALLRQRESASLSSILIGHNDDLVALGRLGTRLTTGPFGTAFAATEYVDDGIPMVNPTHISRVGLTPDLHHSVSPPTARRLSRHQLRIGDVVVSRKGDLGRSALVGRGQDGWICGSDCMAIRVDQCRLLPEFLNRILTLPTTQAHLQSRSLAATMPSMNEAMALSIPVPRVALSNQTSRARSAERCASAHDAACEALELSIRLLREREASIVSAAVAGQIDVTTARGVAEHDL